MRKSDTKERRIDEITAVQKLIISNPGTMKETPQSKTTLIRKAVIPKVTIDIGIKMICNTGFMKVLTTPTATAVTIRACVESNSKPGTI